jgi:hypothetical protein
MKGQVRTESTGKGEKHVIATSACLSYRVIEFLGMQSTSTQHLMGPGVSLFETGCRESQLLEIIVSQFYVLVRDLSWNLEKV